MIITFFFIQLYLFCLFVCSLNTRCRFFIKSCQYNKRFYFRVLSFHQSFSIQFSLFVVNFPPIHFVWLEANFVWWKENEKNRDKYRQHGERERSANVGQIHVLRRKEDSNCSTHLRWNKNKKKHAYTKRRKTFIYIVTVRSVVMRSD